MDMVTARIVLYWLLGLSLLGFQLPQCERYLSVVGRLGGGGGGEGEVLRMEAHQNGMFPGRNAITVVDLFGGKNVHPNNRCRQELTLQCIFYYRLSSVRKTGYLLSNRM